MAEPEDPSDPLPSWDFWDPTASDARPPVQDEPPPSISDSFVDPLSALPAVSRGDFAPLSDEAPDATRPAIAFAVEPITGEVVRSDELPLQDRIAGLTGARVEITLDRVSNEQIGGAPPVDLPTRYHWLSTLGEGGQGSVELVLDRDLGRQVALKTLLPDKRGERQLLDLYREARITGQLDHPHIITIYDAGQLPDGRLYYTMPRMPGESLHNVLVRLRRGEPDAARRWRQIPLVQVLVRACQGVGYAHSRGVIHRDLKPANILLGEHGEVLVVDWGIARVLGGPTGDAPAVRRLWSLPGDERRERVRGSPPYMAPEQIQHPDQVTGAADVFCLGVMLYEALTRVVPFAGDDVDEIVDALCHDRPVPPRERAPELSIPASLEEICLRALEKFPGHRYADAHEMAEALDDFLSGGKRQQAASRRLREAASMRSRHRALSERRAAARRALGDVAVPVGTALREEAIEEQRALRERLDSLDRATEGVFSEAAWAAHRALALDPDHPEARELLGELYAARYAEAEARGSRREMAWFRALLRQFDDRRWSRWMRSGASLGLSTLPHGAGLELVRLSERSGRLIPGERIDPGPDGRWQVPPGRYALARPPEGDEPPPWHYAVRLAREQRRSLVLDLRGEEDAGDLFCFVPGGPAVLGGDDRADGGGAVRTPLIGPFAIARHPVTVGAYARFLAWVGEDRVALARRHRPPDFDAQLESGETRPVTGVRHQDAFAYCTWLTEASGVTLRLPDADQWEKAARAADARAFPWGDELAPDSCACLWGGTPGDPPPPVGSHPSDRSPFGVEDCGGGVWEWTATAAGDRRTVVGGSIVSHEAGCRSAVRRALDPEQRLPFLGFRVIRELGVEPALSSAPTRPVG
jgi:eukaryotic-like serine/threonine-protein kinase